MYEELILVPRTMNLFKNYFNERLDTSIFHSRQKHWDIYIYLRTVISATDLKQLFLFTFKKNALLYQYFVLLSPVACNEALWTRNTVEPDDRMVHRFYIILGWSTTNSTNNIQAISKVPDMFEKS